MRRGTYRLRSLLFAGMTSMLLFASGVASGAQHDRNQTIRVGREGDIVFDTEARVGDLTLRPGRYRFQHRMDGSTHYVNFWELTLDRFSRSWIPMNPAAEVRCKLEPLDRKASGTRVFYSKEEGVVRLFRVEVAGENVAHVFYAHGGH